MRVTRRPARALVFSGTLGVCLLFLVGAPERALVVQAVAVAMATVLAWRPWRRLGRAMAIFGPALLITVAALGSGDQAVRRWLSVGPLNIEVGALCVPPLIAMLLSAPRPAYALSVGFAAVALATQPAPVAATALAFAVCLARELTLRGPLILLTIACAGLAWWWDVPLPPVEHVEGIFMAAITRHPLLGVAVVGVIAVVVQAAPHPVLGGAVALFGVAPLVGAWPVPFAGFGASIWIGVGLAYGLSAAPASPERRSGRRPGDPPWPAP